MQDREKRASYAGLWARLMLLIAGIMCLSACQQAEAASFAERAESMAEIVGVRFNTDDTRTRIVIDATKETSYKVSVLSEPQRIVLDIQNAWIGEDITRSRSIDSEFASTLRIAQNDESTVRVVVESPVGRDGYSIFGLPGGTAGHRIVMDFGNLEESGSTSTYSGSGSTAGGSTNTSSGSDNDYSGGTYEAGGNASSDSGTYSSAGSDSDDGDESDSSSGNIIYGGSGDLSGKVIVLDAGHGGSDVGAIGPSGVTEKSVTLRVAKALQQRLAADGATVIMTRSTDTEVAPNGYEASDIEELQARCDIGNDSDADIFVSLHMDSFTTSVPSGTTGYYYVNGSQASKNLATYLSQGLIAAVGTNNRGVKSCNFYVVKNTDMPATLIEMAFLSNEREEALFNSEAGINKAVEGLLNGIRKYFA